MALTGRSGSSWPNHNLRQSSPKKTNPNPSRCTAAPPRAYHSRQTQKLAKLDKFFFFFFLARAPSLLSIHPFRSRGARATRTQNPCPRVTGPARPPAPLSRLGIRTVSVRTISVRSSVRPARPPVCLSVCPHRPARFAPPELQLDRLG